MPRPATHKPATPARARKKAPAPRTRLHVDERRADLLALGVAMFAEWSYDEVSIDDLARAAGVSKGLLYHYFPTKRDLYVAALGETARRLIDETTTEREGTPDERLRQGIITYLDFVERRGKAYVALLRGGIGSDPEVAAIVESTRRTFAERVLAVLPDEVKKPLVLTALRGWVGFVEATSIDWVAGRSVPREALVDLIAGVLTDGVMRATTIAAAAPAAKKGKARPR